VNFIEAVPFGSIVDGSGWAVAFWAVLYVTRMVLKGQLVTRTTHEATLEALAIERKRNELLLRQVERAADSLETFERFVQALPQPSPVPTPALPAAPQRSARPRRERPPERVRQDRWDEQWGGWNPPGERRADEPGRDGE
jgi:hypothetical protein